ncbi:hypothetical protein B0H14DRAFT_2801812 [Mycena olivaceomarginata]|nr:hypothetical protein B0H14DRAFT_2801812 [Mycena olivaceomarginata]
MMLADARTDLAIGSEVGAYAAQDGEAEGGTSVSKHSGTFAAHRIGRVEEEEQGEESREEGKWHICIDQRAPDRTLPPRGCSPYRTRRPRGEEEACMHRWRRRERERRRRWSGWGGLPRPHYERPQARRCIRPDNLPVLLPRTAPSPRLSTRLYDLLHDLLSSVCPLFGSKRPCVPVIAAVCIPGGRCASPASPGRGDVHSERLRTHRG